MPQFIEQAELKQLYEGIASRTRLDFNSLDQFEKLFHIAMQNPVDGVVSFDGVSRELLHNGMLRTLSDYFITNDGNHLFGKSINQLVITNVSIHQCNMPHLWQNLMPNGTEYIANLIAKNPNIAKIDLSNTGLDDADALTLITALKKNTQLIELKLDGNPICNELLTLIEHEITTGQLASKFTHHGKHSLFWQTAKKMAELPLETVAGVVPIAVYNTVMAARN